MNDLFNFDYARYYSQVNETQRGDAAPVISQGESYKQTNSSSHRENTQAALRELSELQIARGKTSSSRAESSLRNAFGKIFGRNSGSAKPLPAESEETVVSTKVRIDFARGGRAQPSGTRNSWRGSVPQPYPADEALIKDLVDAIKAAEAAEGRSTSTSSVYKSHLTRFSAWLRQHGKDGLSDRLFDDELTRDTHTFSRELKRNDTTSAMTQLREMVRSGAVKITAADRVFHTPPIEDEWLIDQIFPSGSLGIESTYRSSLRGFAEWLDKEGRVGLCDPEHLHSDELMTEAWTYTNRLGAFDHLKSALMRLREFERTGSIVLQRRRDTLNIPEADKQLIENLKAWLVAQGKEGKADRYGTTNAGKHASSLRSFSAWLQEKGMEPISARLHDGSLDADFDIWCEGKSDSAVRTMRTYLRRLRETPQFSPFFLPQTPSGGWDSFASLLNGPSVGSESTFGDLGSLPSQSGHHDFNWGQNVWTPDVTGSYRPEEPTTSASTFGDLGSLPSQSSHHDFDWGQNVWTPNATGFYRPEERTTSVYDLESLSSLSSLPSQPDGADSWNAPTPYQHDTRPQGTVLSSDAASSRRRVPTFDESDTGPGWIHGSQRAPQWLLDRGVYDQQIVRICDFGYRVVAMPDRWGQSVLYLYPHLRGG